MKQRSMTLLRERGRAETEHEANWVFDLPPINQVGSGVRISADERRGHGTETVYGMVNTNRLGLMLAAVMLVLGVSGCAKVDTILLTSDTFPPRSSSSVIVLERTPSEPYIELAELRMGDSWLSFGSMQQKILKRAAVLGADAVVFTSPETQTIQRVAYEPLYDPWGYTSPYYGSPWGYGSYGGWGPWGGFASGSVAVPYDETVNMLMGTAIRYTKTTQPLTPRPLK